MIHTRAWTRVSAAATAVVSMLVATIPAAPAAASPVVAAESPAASVFCAPDLVRALDAVSTDVFVWDTNAGVPLLLEDGTHRYLYGAGSAPIAQVDQNDQVEWLLPDRLGSVTVVADDAGAVLGAVAYGPYGVVEGASGAASAFGYTGALTDPDTGLVYLRARDYDPATMQFLQVDPLVDQTRAAYAYASNSPLIYTDPLGLSSSLCPGGDADWGCNALVNVGSIFVGIGDGVIGTADFLANGPRYLLFGGPTMLDAFHGLLGNSAGLCEVTTSGFHTFGALWGGAAAGPIGEAKAAEAAAKVFASNLDEAVFWSGIGKDGEGTAAAWAAENGGVTLETTMAANGVKLPVWDPASPSVVAAWENASLLFAQGARGNVRVLQGDAVGIGSVWAKLEYPALTANPNVTSITSINPTSGVGSLLWNR